MGHQNNSFAAGARGFADAAGSPPWYLLQVKPGGLERAEVNLKRQGVECFMPRQTKPATSPSKPKPLYPGYLFASFSPDLVPIRSINATYGVSRLVTMGYDLNRGLPEDLISGLKERCDEAGHIQPPLDLKNGETIRITGGPFADYLARVDSMSASERVRVLFDLLGQTIRADVDVRDVVRC